MTPIRVFLAEDHQMVRSALVALIALEEDIEVVGEAGRGDEALEAILALRPDVALLDIDMPGLDGLQVVERLATLAPGCATLVVTAIGKYGALQRAVRSQARGFIPKHAPADDLLAAIRTVAAGGRVVDPALAAAAIEAGANGPTERELDVVRLIADGLSSRQIAGALHLSEGTVRNYTSNLQAKFGARNRVDLVRIAQDEGWL